MPIATTPTEADYLTFLRTTVGITTDALSDDNDAIGISYALSLETVNRFFKSVAPALYVWAVYNLAAALLFDFAQDTPPSTFFADARKAWNINSFVAGVVNSASDNGTSAGTAIPAAFNELTLADLQLLKTPWGRNYLSIAQKWGPDLFGIS